jgi:hypothetical protein
MRQLLRRGSFRVRTVTLLALIGILAASELALGGGTSHLSTRHPSLSRLPGATHEPARVTDQEIRFLFLQAGLPEHHGRDLTETSSAGRGKLVVPGQDPEGKIGRVVGKFSQELVSKVTGTDRMTVSFKTGKYEDLRFFGQKVLLYGDVTVSDDPLCPAEVGGSPRAVGVILREGTKEEPTSVSMDVAGCHRHSYYVTARANLKAARVQVVIDKPVRCQALVSTVPKCPATTAPQPTKLTLTVNGRSVTATTAAPSAHLSQGVVFASQTPVTIRVASDRPMPRGWKVVVFHNGDPLSQGNGVYYKVCELNATTTATSCGDTRPGRVGPFDDTVFAQVLSPTGLVFNTEIDFHFNAP